ncbi:sensor histidine kinase [Streptomyces olivoreticuli]|uniref:sensor histidine kinase n=1 Tax=Streptomyces olivoreticuli TaxID=68246 RepID=UPI001F076620|nr:HAMP domain-containing sensor histidine kinase [Streptomyces olivoreticuli]
MRLKHPGRIRVPHPAAFLRALPFRTRLAAAFAGLFLLAGVILLAFVIALAGYGTAQQVQGTEVTSLPGLGTDGGTPAPASPTAPGAPRPPFGNDLDDGIAIRLVDQTVSAVQETALHQMLLWSGIGLVLIALLAGVMGWWLAGRALRPVAAVTDTARRISEQNLHERLALTGPDDELHKLAGTFDTMLDRLEKSFESQRRFVANASHELRTPLAAQRASLEVGLADPLPDGLADVREDLLATNRDAEKLIASLLLLARSDRGLAETEETDLTEEARQAVGEMRILADEEDVSLTLTADDPLSVTGDPVLLRHLVTNLVRNAVQYNRSGGSVSVRLTGRTLTVANTGRPVAPDQVAQLFEPFRRLGQDRVGTCGHGLGLSIVKSIADAHGATVTACPAADGGLTVAVTFRGS